MEFLGLEQHFSDAGKMNSTAQMIWMQTAVLQANAYQEGLIHASLIQHGIFRRN